MQKIKDFILYWWAVIRLTEAQVYAKIVQFHAMFFGDKEDGDS